LQQILLFFDCGIFEHPARGAGSSLIKLERRGDVFQMNIRFLEAPREVTFDWHVVQATKWLEFDAGRELDSVLIYAAAELRAAIERYIFELLYLLKEGKLSADEEKRCRSITGHFCFDERERSLLSQDD
jgi:hypothetical protein